MHNNNLSKLLKIIIPIVIIVVICGSIFIWYNNFYRVDKNSNAQDESFMAIRYFEGRNWDRALNGDGNYPGFLTIIDKYKGTNTANIANYYTGIIYLNESNYDSAIKYFSQYNAKDDVTKITVLGLLGDSNVELKKYDEAVSYYKKAINEAKNKEGQFGSIYMLKLGLVYEALNKNKDALDTYNEIKRLYINPPIDNIDKYIGRAEAKL